MEEHLFRIFQEALQNALKHANATIIDVTFHVTGRALVLRVVDNGRGITVANNSTGMGLANMRERAGLLNAEFNVSRRPGGGTEVLVQIAHDA